MFDLKRFDVEQILNLGSSSEWDVWSNFRDNLRNANRQSESDKYSLFNHAIFMLFENWKQDRAKRLRRQKQAEQEHRTVEVHEEVYSSSPDENDDDNDSSFSEQEGHGVDHMSEEEGDGDGGSTHSPSSAAVASGSGTFSLTYPHRRGGKGVMRRSQLLPTVPRVTQQERRQRSRVRDRILYEEGEEAYDKTVEVLEPPVSKKRKKMTRDEKERLVEEEDVENHKEILQRAIVKVEDTVQFDEHGQPMIRDQWNVPVTSMRDPNEAIRVRDRNEGFVKALMAQMVRRPFAFVKPLVLLIDGVKSIAEVNFRKLHVHRYQVLGGAHSVEAAKRLYNSRPTNMDKDIERNILYKPCIILLDIMSNAECRSIGKAHNVDAQLYLRGGFMDELRYFRREWFDEYKHKVEECGEGSTGGLIAEWQTKCLKDLGVTIVDKRDLRKYSPQFVTARWDERPWKLLKKISDMHEKYELPEQAAKKKKMTKPKPNEPYTVASIPKSHILGMNGLKEEKLLYLLNRIKNGQTTIASAHNWAMEEKNKERCRNAVVYVMKKNTIAEVEEEIGKARLDTIVKQHSSQFKKVPNMLKLPSTFKQTVKKMMSQAEQIAAGNTARGNTEQCAEYLCDRVVLGPTFEAPEKKKDEVAGNDGDGEEEGDGSGGSEEADGSGGSDETVAEERKPDYSEFLDKDGNLVRNKLYSIQANILDDLLYTTVLPSIDGTEFELVIMDPPYGLKRDQEWDMKPLGAEDFKLTLKRLVSACKLPGFTFVSFCSAFQISGFLNELNKFEDSNWKCHSSHGIWYKPNVFVKPSYGTLQAADEFMVYGWFTRKDAQSQAHRNLFKQTEDADRLTVINVNTIRNRLMCPDQDGLNVTVNPCQKPVRLIMKLVEFYTVSGGTVLDLCSGTGTTAVACGLMNRNCYSVDNNPFQVHKQRERFAKFASVLDGHDKEEFFYIGKTNEFQ